MRGGQRRDPPQREGARVNAAMVSDNNFQLPDRSRHKFTGNSTPANDEDPWQL